MEEQLEGVENLPPLPQFQGTFDWSPDVDVPSVAMLEFYGRIRTGATSEDKTPTDEQQDTAES